MLVAAAAADVPAVAAAAGTQQAALAAAAGGGGVICASDDVCSGASAALPASDCVGWKELMVTTNGSGWALRGGGGAMADALFNDPCGCDGHVTCEVVGGRLRITAISLANASLAGFLRQGPYRRSALPSIVSL